MSCLWQNFIGDLSFVDTDDVESRKEGISVKKKKKKRRYDFIFIKGIANNITFFFFRSLVLFILLLKIFDDMYE